MLCYCRLSLKFIKTLTMPLTNIVTCFTVANLWNEPLPEWELTTLNIINFQDTVEEHGIKIVGFACKSMSIYYLFTPYAHFSHQSYQPRGNHRHLQYTCFYHQTVDDNGDVQQPLMDSLIYNDSVEKSFGRGECVSFCPYQLEECDHALDLAREEQVLSSARVRYTAHSNKKSRGMLRNRKGKPLTKEVFKRTLEVFGLKRENEDSEISINEVSSFLY